MAGTEGFIDSSGVIQAVSAAKPLPVTTASGSPISATGITAIVGGSLTRPNDTSAYAVGDIVAQSTTAGSCSGVAVAVARAINSTGMLRRCRVKVNDTAWAAAELYIHVFKDTPTFANGDNGAMSAGTTESNYIGAFDVTLSRTFSDFVKGVGVPLNGSEMNFDPSSGTQNIFFVIETRTVVTPSASKVFSVTFEVLQN